MSLQVTPSPEKPPLQPQVRGAPILFVQGAFALQPPLEVVHSLMSVQVTPAAE